MLLDIFQLTFFLRLFTFVAGTEDSSMIYENDTETVVERLTHDGSSLPSRINLSAIASSSNDSVHNLHALRNGDSLLNRRNARQGLKLLFKRKKIKRQLF